VVLFVNWAQRVCKDAAVVRNHFVFFEWINLHFGPHFEAVVEYLRTLLDKDALLLDEHERNVCKRRFLQTVQLELDFLAMHIHINDS
jgi:thiaminase